MDEHKLVKLVGDIVMYVGLFYAMDAVAKFVSDYNATKDRVELLEMADAARVVFRPATAEEFQAARAAGAGIGDASRVKTKEAEDRPAAGRRLKPVKTKDEPQDAVPDQEV